MGFKRHYTKFTTGNKSMAAAGTALVELGWAEGDESGFIKDKDSTAENLSGKCLYTKEQKIKYLDTKTLEECVELRDTLKSFRFGLSRPQGLAHSDGARGDLQILYNMLEQFNDFHCAFDPLNVNLVEVFEVLANDHKLKLVAIKIRNFVTRDGMKATAIFKISDPQDERRLLKKYADQLDAITVQIKTMDGPVKVNMTGGGSVSGSYDAGDSFYEQVAALFVECHEAAVETTEVYAPAQRKIMAQAR